MRQSEIVYCIFHNLKGKLIIYFNVFVDEFLIFLPQELHLEIFLWCCNEVYSLFIIAARSERCCSWSYYLFLLIPQMITFAKSDSFPLITKKKNPTKIWTLEHNRDKKINLSWVLSRKSVSIYAKYFILCTLTHEVINHMKIIAETSIVKTVF